MKRGRRSLSGDQGQHAEQQHSHVRRAVQNTEVANGALERHDCVNAGLALLRAAEGIGAYHAEKEWTGRGSRAGARAEKEYATARRKLYSRCLGGKR